MISAMPRAERATADPVDDLLPELATSRSSINQASMTLVEDCTLCLRVLRTNREARSWSMVRGP